MMNLKVQSYNHASVQITNIGIFALIANLIFKLLSRKFLFINRKDSRNFLKVGYFFNKIANFKGKLQQNFQDTFETPKRSFISVSSVCMTAPLRSYKTI